MCPDALKRDYLGVKVLLLVGPLMVLHETQDESSPLSKLRC